MVVRYADLTIKVKSYVPFHLFLYKPPSLRMTIQACYARSGSNLFITLLFGSRAEAVLKNCVIAKQKCIDYVEKWSF